MNEIKEQETGATDEQTEKVDWTARELDTIGLAMAVIMANPSDERRFNGIALIRRLESCGIGMIRLIDRRVVK